MWRRALTENGTLSVSLPAGKAGALFWINNFVSRWASHDVGPFYCAVRSQPKLAADLFPVKFKISNDELLPSASACSFDAIFDPGSQD
jgi:hypothetical protein